MGTIKSGVNPLTVPTQGTSKRSHSTPILCEHSLNTLSFTVVRDAVKLGVVRGNRWWQQGSGTVIHQVMGTVLHHRINYQLPNY